MCVCLCVLSVYMYGGELMTTTLTVSPVNSYLI